MNVVDFGTGGTVEETKWEKITKPPGAHLHPQFWFVKNKLREIKECIGIILLHGRI